MPPRGALTLHLAWAVWGVSLAAYALGTFHRSSLAVAGLHATERFGISATQLGFFVMLQLAIYALLQVPVGVLVDRFGARRVLLTGIVVMSIGQMIFALTDSYPVAVFARVLVGIGDATTFVCVLRLINSWFPPGRIPMLTQISGPIGQLGSMAAAIPMTVALAHVGWEKSYLAVALLGAAAALLVVVLVADVPDGQSMAGAPMSIADVRSGVAASWAETGTRLGFWIHFSQHFSASLLGLLWGFPFFVRAEGTSEETAALLLTVMIVAIIATGPLLGWFVSRMPRWRAEMVLTSIGMVAGMWGVVLAWPGSAPIGLLFVLVIVVGASGPVAMVGFDYARHANPPARLASAVGLVNQGGFIASLTAILLIGVILDVLAQAGVQEGDAYVAALSVQFVLWAGAATQIWRLNRRLPDEAFAPRGTQGSAGDPARETKRFRH